MDWGIADFRREQEEQTLLAEILEVVVVAVAAEADIQFVNEDGLALVKTAAAFHRAVGSGLHTEFWWDTENKRVKLKGHSDMAVAQDVTSALLVYSLDME